MEGDMAKVLEVAEVQKNITKLVGWEVSGEGLRRSYQFKDFAEALRFVNRVGGLAEQMDHHPDIFLHGYKNVTLTLTTHQAEASDGSKVSGLTSLDFELARRIDNA